MSKTVAEYPKRSKLKKLFEYRNGKLIWKESRGGVRKGQSAGYRCKKGYLRIRIDGTEFRGSRLVWIFHKGDIPKGYVIDHKDFNPKNDRIENLEALMYRQNVVRKLENDERNVYPTSSGKWMIQFFVEGTKRYFGSYENKEVAIDKAHHIRKVLGNNT